MSVFKLLGAVVLLVLVPVAACGGRTADDGGGAGPGSGGFPYAGPSCESPNLPSGCWACLQSECPGAAACVTTTCQSYFRCYCPCAATDFACQNDCGAGPASEACQGCLQGDSSCVQSHCQEACSSSSSSSGTPTATPSSGGPSPSATSTGSGSSSGGPPTSTVCHGAPSSCTSGQPESFCQVSDGTGCVEAYYLVGSARIECASCTDTSGCGAQAVMVCGQ